MLSSASRRLAAATTNPSRALARALFSSKSPAASLDLFNPTEEHKALREMFRQFVETEVDPQALEYNRKEQFNRKLFNRLGELGVLGITADPECGGTGMDATAACIVHGKLTTALS